MGAKWNLTTRYIVGIGLFLFLLFVIYISESILPSLVIAALIAFLVKPVIDHLHQRFRIPRGIATVITYFITVIVIILTPLILIPPILSAANSILGYDYQSVGQDVISWFEGFLVGIKLSRTGFVAVDQYLDSIIDPLLSTIRESGPMVLPELPPAKEILDLLGSAVTSGVSIAISVVGAAVSVLISLAFILVFSVYMVNDTDRFYDAFIGIIPVSQQEEVKELLRRVSTTMTAWLRGEITLMLSVGALVWIGNLILGVPGAFFLGVIAGVFELIPTLGPFLALVPALLVALTQGSLHLGVNNLIFALIVLVFYGAVQQFENTFIVPRVMGRELKLHPLIVLVGVVVGAEAFGVLGALLAAPVIAMAQLILAYLYRKVLGEDPFPGGSEAGRRPGRGIQESTRLVGTWASRFLPRRKPAEGGLDAAPEAERGVGTRDGQAAPEDAGERPTAHG
jgi:predicted PurR-regulated permease PerM